MIFVHTLGTASIDVGSCSINPTSPRKFALLLYLAVERGRRVPRTRIAHRQGREVGRSAPQQRRPQEGPRGPRAQPPLLAAQRNCDMAAPGGG